MNPTAFSGLGLHDDLLRNLSSLGYESMTEVQAQGLPPILAGRDIIAQSRTGSGKTAAFGLGLLNKLDARTFRPQSLVLCPTRELADQVARELRRLARATKNIKILTLCGGSAFAPQLSSLAHGAHIVVGTPGRIEDHLNRGTLALNTVNTLVLDEADRMLDMGFQSALDAIVGHTPSQRQTLLFSATFPPQIQAIAERVMIDPLMVQAGAAHDHASIEQHFYRVTDDDQRLLALRLLLLHFRPASTLVFCNTKRETRQVAAALSAYGFAALALNGDLEQRERDQTLTRFANNSASVLVATDVAARGLDIDALDAVINYHIAHSPEIHVHRIGRTGRAGSSGTACSLYDASEAHKVALIDAGVDPITDREPLPPLRLLQEPVMTPPMVTLQIDGGRRQKLRPGDILGALTGTNGIDGKQVGKISMADNWAYVAVSRDALKPAMAKLRDGKLKGRSFRVRWLRD